MYPGFLNIPLWEKSDPFLPSYPQCARIESFVLVYQCPLKPVMQLDKGGETNPSGPEHMCILCANILRGNRISIRNIKDLML